ncbi:hypothetical protein B566_EDAN006733 [Ephemera danica]|nr:hypothetical protein B566_EDAN006733 [Ephemera danica]
MKETSTETAAQKGKKGKGQWECKHCHRRFKMAHGLKMHIKLYHYGLGTWQCGYCPATMTSEHVTLLHCRASHPEQPEKAVKNTKQKVTLDNEFWEREYGIVHGTAPIETTEEPPGNYNKKCQYCSYTTNLSATLKLHEMRHWVQKPFGCGYCKFQGVSEYNMKTHCAKLHPDLPVKVITNSLPNKPQIKPLKRIKRRTSVKVAAQTTPPTGGDNDLEILEEVEEESSAVDKNQTESDTSTTAPPAEPAMLYRCFYCPRKSLKLPDIHQHWLSKHKNPDNSESPFRYKSIPLPEVLQNKDPSVIKNCVCAYCDFKGPMNTLKSHHLTWHPDKDFKIVGSKKSSFKCSHCDFTAFTVTALKLHIETKHPSEHFNYQIQNRPVTVSNLGTLAETSPVPSSSKYLCLWCNETCENREKIDLHNKCFHSHLEPKFEPVPLTVTNPPLPIAKSEVPASTATLPSISINPNRRLFLCPDCPHKTMTLRVMRAHVSKIHVKELECPQCGIVLADKKAAIMHIYVEHPKLDKSKTLMPKCKAKVDHKMLFVKREGEDEKHDFCEVNITDILSKQTSPINESPPLPSTLFPESSPSNSSLQPEPTYSSTNSILQPESTCSSTKSLLQLESMRSSTNSLLQPGPRYLSTNSMLQSESRSEPSLSESAFDSSLTSPPSKKRCVAKKSTSKPCKNTARKSFPSSSWSPLLMVDTEESSEYESEDEGQSAYIHPSEREALQPLSTMPHLSTELNVGTSAPITVTVDKLALLMNLEPKVKVSDLKN